MNTPNIPERLQPYRQAAINSFAVIGFIALIALGVWGAVYSSRYVPAAANRVGTAAVYIGSLFIPAPAPNIGVVPTASSTVISFGNASSTVASTETNVPSSPSTPTAGNKTYNTSQISGAPAASALHGLPDFLVTISAIGYLDTTSTNSFIATSTVPAGSRPAVKFTIKNIGTNVSGQWRFSADIPTRTSYTYKSDSQQSLAPGESIDYTLGFDRANTGTNLPLTLTANYDNAVTESNTNNNSISVNLTILGS